MTEETAGHVTEDKADTEEPGADAEEAAGLKKYRKTGSKVAVMSVEQAYQVLFSGALIVLLFFIGALVIRSVIGPRSTDRIMCVNMLGTMTICSIAILSFLLKEGYLADVALIYAMISFVAVLMMASMFIPVRIIPPRLSRTDRKGREVREKEEVQQSVKAQNANENKGAQAAEKAQSVPAGTGGDAQ